MENLGKSFLLIIDLPNFDMKKNKAFYQDFHFLICKLIERIDKIREKMLEKEIEEEKLKSIELIELRPKFIRKLEDMDKKLDVKIKKLELKIEKLELENYKKKLKKIRDKFKKRMNKKHQRKVRKISV